MIECEPLRRLATRNEYSTGLLTIETVALPPSALGTMVRYQRYATVNALDFAVMSRHTRKYLNNVARVAVDRETRRH